MIKMKKIIYLDYNVFINCMKTNSIFEKITSLNKDFDFYYAPPYLEEVANIPTGKKEEINNHLNAIDQIFQKRIFRPVEDGDIVPYNESARTVYNRVIKLFDLTIWAEHLEKGNLSYISSFRSNHNIQTKIVSNVPYNEILSSLNVKQYIDARFDKEFFMDPLKNKQYLNNHRDTESLVNLLFNTLERIGYKPEKSGTNKSRSRMHDVSHAIYATKADYFIVDDKKFREKCKAVYHALGVPTKVYSYNDWIASLQ